MQARGHCPLSSQKSLRKSQMKRHPRSFKSRLTLQWNLPKWNLIIIRVTLNMVVVVDGPKGDVYA